MKISLIAAQSANRVIGKDNKLLWHLPEDLKHFKKMTLGKPIIMGSRTYYSIGRPLPNRLNIVLSHQSNLKIEGCAVVHTLESAFNVAKDADEIMVIGGGALYKQCLPLADCLYLTTLRDAYEGDTFFPELNAQEWQIQILEQHERFIIEKWQRLIPTTE